MADTKITALATGATLHADDWLAGVDTHDTSMDATGTTKKFAPSVLAAALTIAESQVTGLVADLLTLSSGLAGVTTTTQAANRVYAGPTTGAAASPTFRALVAADIPNIAESQVTNLVSDLAAKEPAITAGTTAQYLRGDKSLATLNQAAVAGLTTASSPTFAGLTVGTLSGILKASTGVLSVATAGTDYLTGNQTVTLSGDVAGSGATAITTTIGANKVVTSMIAAANVTYAKIQAVAASSLLGNPTGSAAAPSEITLGSGLSFSGTTLVASGGSGSPGGSTTQVQYNNAGAFAGAASLTIGSGGQLNFGAISAPGSPVDGDSWYDSAQLTPTSQRKGMTAASVGLLFSQVTNVTVTTNSATTLLSSTSAFGTLTLPAGFLNVVGKTLRIKGGGHYSTGAAAGQVSFALKLGSNIVATNTAAVTENANVANQKVFIDIIITTKATGASGKLDISGKVAQWFANGTTFGIYLANGTTMSAGAPQTQVTLDLTASYTIDFQIQMNVTVNSYTLANFTVEALN